MKNKKLLCFCTIMIVCIANKNLLSQSTNGGAANQQVLATDFLGWNTIGGAFPLNVKTEQNQPIHFYTNSGAATLLNNKMSIMRRIINTTEHAGIGIHWVGTNPITNPRSILHLGNDYLGIGNIGGWRTWMDVGTFCGLQSDFAFFGIMAFDGDTTGHQADHNDAVVLWGDNEDPADDGADNLRFIFSAPMTQTANDWQTQYSALETGRFEPHGRLGIGNFTANAWGGGSGIQPLRRLEVYDEHLNTTLAAAPQLRLTFTPHANVALGEHTDFQAMTNGDLFIHPSTDVSGSQSDRLVGVNVSTPASVMHLYGINVPTGEMFRSDGVSSDPQYWRMLRNGTHYGWIWNNATTADANDFCIGSPSSSVKFYSKSGTYSGATTPVTERMIVTDGSGVLAGFIGIGNNFITPQSRLHINQGSSEDCWLQMTTTLTANTNAGLDGLRIGVENASMNVQIKQQEIADMLFYTTDATAITERMRIKSGGNVGIGLTAPIAKLHVYNNYSTTAVISAAKFESEASSGNNAIGAHAVVSSGNALKGFYANVDNYTSSAGINAENMGLGCQVQGHDNGSTNYGVKATVYGTNQNGSSINYGIWSSSGGSSEAYDCYGIKTLAFNVSNNCYGGYFEANGGNNANLNYAVYATVPTGCTVSAGCIDYGVYSNGAIGTTLGFFAASDAQLKTNVQVIPNAKQLLSQLYPKVYSYEPSYMQKMSLPTGNHYGFIADSVQLVLPGIIRNAKQPAKLDSTGNVIYQEFDYKMMNYIELIPILTAVVKEQELRIDSLINALISIQPLIQQNQNNQLQNQNSALKVTLNNAIVIYLSQNIPNPFDDNTTISFSIPVEVKTAQIIFTENNGVVLKSMDITQRGESSLTVFGENLSKGIYSYSLIIDGKVFETKKMVKM